MVTANYEDMARELKLADDRANKAANDAQHFEGLLREEQVKASKIDNVKKALETEVKNLTIRMEEIETTAISSSKRTIMKMEQRIEELEQHKLHLLEKLKGYGDKGGLEYIVKTQKLENMQSKEFDARVVVEDYDPAKAREKADQELAEEMAKQKKKKKAANE